MNLSRWQAYDDQQKTAFSRKSVRWSVTISCLLKGTYSFIATHA